MKVLSFLLYIIHHRIMLRGLLLFWIYFSQGFRHLLERLSHMDAVLGAHLKELHALSFAELLGLIFGNFAVLLLTVNLVPQNA
jgi:hypothetical protein